MKGQQGNEDEEGQQDDGDEEERWLLADTSSTRHVAALAKLGLGQDAPPGPGRRCRHCHYLAATRLSVADLRGGNGSSGRE